jgi:hypothetical protein
MSDERFLSRWSRRKSEAKAPATEATPSEPAPRPEIAKEGEREAPVEARGAPPEPLPPIASLTPDSDFAAFMKPEVDPSLKREAFKKLIEDPRYNVMDGLDVYIDDYSKPDPLPEGWLEKMTAVRYLGIFKDDAQLAREAEEARAGEVAAAEPAAPPAAMESQPDSFPEKPPAIDTSSDEIPPPDVGKPRDMKEGS